MRPLLPDLDGGDRERWSGDPAAIVRPLVPGLFDGFGFARCMLIAAAGAAMVPLAPVFGLRLFAYDPSGNLRAVVFDGAAPSFGVVGLMTAMVGVGATAAAC